MLLHLGAEASRRGDPRLGHGARLAARPAAVGLVRVARVGGCLAGTRAHWGASWDASRTAAGSRGQSTTGAPSRSPRTGGGPRAAPHRPPPSAVARVLRASAKRHARRRRGSVPPARSRRAPHRNCASTWRFVCLSICRRICVRDPAAPGGGGGAGAARPATGTQLADNSCRLVNGRHQFATGALLSPGYSPLATESGVDGVVSREPAAKWSAAVCCCCSGFVVARRVPSRVTLRSPSAARPALRRSFAALCAGIIVAPRARHAKIDS